MLNRVAHRDADDQENKMSQQNDSTSDPTDDGPWASPVGTPRPVVPVSETAAVRLRVRELGAGDGVEPTRYVGDTVLVPGLPGWSAQRALDVLDEIAAEREMEPPLRLRDGGRDDFIHSNDLAGRIDEVTSTAVRFVVPPGSRPIDAWELLREAREDAGHAEALAGVELSHVVGPAPAFRGGVYAHGVGGGYSSGVGGGYSSGVGDPFALYSAGRAPVEWGAPSPRPPGAGDEWADDWGDDGPVVAVVDTGLGRHPWFKDGVVRDLRIGGQPVGLRFAPDDDPEHTGVTVDRVNGGLDTLAGHGTFIAGIIRQRCPSATIVSVPVMYGDGSAAEDDLIAALEGLLAHQLHALAGSTEGRPIDVLSLSLGYYHEAPSDIAATGRLAWVLKGLSDAGVAVVAAAGNDASVVEFYPAALAAAPWSGVPLVSVGATTMDHPLVASYSNTGPWVVCYRAGTNVVSTMPTTFDGSGHASMRTSGLNTTASGFTVPKRATPDVDNYSGGFGIWGGTSFAAPVFAAEVAAELAGMSAVTGDRVLDGSAAVRAVLERG